MAKIKSKVSQSSEHNIVQNASQGEQQAFQNEKKVVQRIEPRYPNWPTSKPGSRSTPPFAGMCSVNPFRPEQVTQMGSNQEAGPLADSPQCSVPNTSIQNQPKNALDTLGKRKRCL